MPVPDEISEIGDADVSYMRRMARGDSHALSSLYQRHGGVALALAERMLGTHDAAEDAVQEAFVALWRHAANYRDGGAAPRTWLLTIVRNRCIDELRKRAGSPQRVELDEAQPQAIERDPWPEIWKRHCGDALRGAMADLPREQREVIELGFFSGHSHSQIAERLGAPLGTVKKRMRTGLKRLRDALDERYAESISS
jgi:RNA polymerase sigma-70 factor (ECF subfamily)